MKNIKMIAVSCAAILLASCGESSNSSSAGGEGQNAPAQAPIEVSAKDISAAFQENEVRAKAEYSGKTLLVTGKIKEIELDMLDRPEVKLAGANEIENMGVSEDGKMTDVSVSGLTTEISAKLNKGETLSVICTNVSEAMGSAMLSKCKPAPNDEASAS